MTLNRSLIRTTIALTALATVICNSQILSAQTDPLKRAKAYPPELLGEDDTKMHLSVIDWQLAQIDDELAEHQKQNEKIKEKESSLVDLITRVSATIPVEQRVIDQSVRSQLAGRLLEDLIDSKLDIVTQESAIAELEKQAAIAASAAQKDDRNTIDVRAAKSKLMHLENNYSRTKALRKNGTIPIREVEEAEFLFTSARLELEKAVAEAEAISNEAYSRIAEQIADLRIKLAATKARVAAAQEALNSLAETESMFAKRQSLERDLMGWQNDRRTVSSQLTKLGMQVLELKSIKKLIQSRTGLSSAIRNALESRLDKSVLPVENTKDDH